MTTVNWEEAGRGWGARAVEWAYLFEPYARPANELLFDRLEIGAGARLLDIACGSGFAAHLAAKRKTQVSGLDAAEALVTIARTRTPSGDFRVGDMFELPFTDDSFDVANELQWHLERMRRCVEGGSPGARAQRSTGADLLGAIRPSGSHAVLPQGHRIVST